MPARLPIVLLRAALLISIVASVVMFVDYRNPGTAAFCTGGSGCGQVRAWLTHSGGALPLPAIGTGVFVGLFALSLWATRRRQARWLALNCTLVAVGALALIGMQLWVVKAICKWCMTVDVSALVAAGAAWWLAREEPAPEGRGQRLLWGALGVVAVAVPMLWGDAPERKNLPAEIVALHVDDRVNIVEFTDFECPFCRQLHTKLTELESEHHGKLALTRLMRPLPGHPGADPAARAYLCTPVDKQDAIADQLYRAEPASLNRAHVSVIATELGVDPAPFQRCLDDPATQATLDQHAALFKTAGLQAVPATFIEDEYVKGADDVAIAHAVRRALSGGSGGPGVGYMLALLGVLLAGACWISLRAPGEVVSDAASREGADDDPEDSEQHVAA